MECCEQKNPMFTSICSCALYSPLTISLVSGTVEKCVVPTNRITNKAGNKAASLILFPLFFAIPTILLPFSLRKLCHFWVLPRWKKVCHLYICHVKTPYSRCMSSMIIPIHPYSSSDTRKSFYSGAPNERFLWNICSERYRSLFTAVCCLILLFITNTVKTEMNVQTPWETLQIKWLRMNLHVQDAVITNVKN